MRRHATLFAILLLAAPLAAPSTAAGDAGFRVALPRAGDVVAYVEERSGAARAYALGLAAHVENDSALQPQPVLPLAVNGAASGNVSLVTNRVSVAWRGCAPAERLCAYGTLEDGLSPGWARGSSYFHGKDVCGGAPVEVALPTLRNASVLVRAPFDAVPVTLDDGAAGCRLTFAGDPSVAALSGDEPLVASFDFAPGEPYARRVVRLLTGETWRLASHAPGGTLLAYATADGLPRDDAPLRAPWLGARAAGPLQAPPEGEGASPFLLAEAREAAESRDPVISALVARPYVILSGQRVGGAGLVETGAPAPLPAWAAEAWTWRLVYQSLETGDAYQVTVTKTIPAGLAVAGHVEVSPAQAYAPTARATAATLPAAPAVTLMGFVDGLQALGISPKQPHALAFQYVPPHRPHESAAWVYVDAWTPRGAPETLSGPPAQVILDSVSGLLQQADLDAPAGRVFG